MPEYAYDELTGAEYILNEDTGEWDYLPETSAGEAFLVNAGATLAQMGRGVQSLFGGDRAALADEQRQDDELLAGLRQSRPVASFAGQIAPSLATLPVGLVGTPARAAALLGTAARPAYLAGNTLSRGLGTSGTLAAIEGMLLLDPDNPDQTNQVLLNMAGALAGEGAGRLLGRAFNSARGLGRELDRSEVSEFMGREGLEMLPSERLAGEATNIAPLQRLEQGAQTGPFTPAVFARTRAQREALQADAAAKAIGLPGGERLTPEMLNQADEAIGEGFQQIADEGMQAGVFQVPEEMGRRLASNNRTQIPGLIERGEFRGLENGVMTAPEMLVARRALSQDAANFAGRGQYELAQRFFDEVDELDRIFAAGVDDPEILARHAKLREQYRNLQILMKPGVIDAEGVVKSPALNRRLREQGGYGRTYALGRDAEVQPETGRLFDVTRNLARPELQPFRSSGTAENQAVRQFGQSVAQLGADPVGGAAGLATQLYAPAVLAAAGGSNRSANVLGGLLQPGSALSGRVGGETGGSLLDLLIADQLGSNANTGEAN